MIFSIFRRCVYALKLVPGAWYHFVSESTA